ncbi:regulator of G-protein signaling 3 isoform D [Patagioenas fasciata monilis]|uniref:Regulator of G-protein signaling 3 isoform D n=1 Tax=Patagioenas fasciata monilis TaxID=372326 RepID=A0A1V4J777_PATFA|nr:regulator of G-protein signaling 3 isoform D [Patagioenas fasciata monilis]
MFQVTLLASAPPSLLSFLESENAEDGTDVRRMTPKAYLATWIHPELLWRASCQRRTVRAARSPVPSRERCCADVTCAPPASGLLSGAKVKGLWQLNRSLSAGHQCLTLLERATVLRGRHGAAGRAGAHAGVLRFVASAVCEDGEEGRDEEVQSIPATLSLSASGTGQSPQLLELERLPALPKGRCRDVQPSLQMSKGPLGSRRKISHAQVKGKGQLKLSVEVRGRTLVLHIMEAKGLMGKECRTCDSYVKTSIVPDADWKCRQKTKTVPDSKNPVFHEHFLFPVQEEDEQKRLLVTVWNRERNSRQSELIGCMSFGVKSLLTLDKEISGWYYLLGEDLGRTKHLKVATRRLKQTREMVPVSQGAAQESGDAASMEQLKGFPAMNRFNGLCKVCSERRYRQITIPRGSDGFGFTICCDSPVRVQAVDSGGPAEKAGLQQLDTVLQLNEQPVEHWKCVELAHEIRNCPTEIILLVWRLVPQVKSGHEGMIRRSSCKSAYDLQSPPNKREKNSTVPPRPEQRRSCHVLYDGSDGLMLNSWERYTEIGKLGQNTMPALSRVPSAADQNYIILAPLNPGSQLLRPVYQENNTTGGSACKGKSHVGSGRKSRLMKTVQTMKNYGNYQNLTIVRPHIPHSSYGTYVTLAPKVLVFPVFVQPLDLCNPARTLLLSEELLLHESRSRTMQVTLFVYSDLLLFTKEDEPGRCNVLRNPLYLQSVQLQEGSEDRKFCILYLAEKSECLLSLEAYSQEQKKRICWCLAENITKQQHPAPAPTENKMLETDAEKPGRMHSEDGKVVMGDAPPAAKASAPCEPQDALRATRGPLLVEEQPVATEKREEQPSSVPAFIIPELRLDSTFSQSVAGTAGGTTDGEDEEEEEEEEAEDEDEEDDEGEDSDEHYLERSDAKRSSMIETSGCQPVYTLSVQSSLRRRTHSEGSLLQEAKSHCFTSDTTLNCSDSQAATGHWALPSPRTLKKELVKNGGSIHQLSLLFSGHRKLSGAEPECSCDEGDETSRKKRSKNL